MSCALLVLVFSFVAHGQAFADGSETPKLGLEFPLSPPQVDANRADLPSLNGPQLDELADPGTDPADDLSDENLRDCLFVARVPPAANRLLPRPATGGPSHPLLAPRGCRVPLRC